MKPTLAEDKGKDGVPGKYEIEDAARTLTRAEEIKQDKRLMPHVHKHLKKQHRAIATSIADLRAMSKKMNDPEDQMDHGADEAKEKN